MKSIVVVLVAGQSDGKRRHMRELGKHVRTTPQWSLPNEICFEGIRPCVKEVKVDNPFYRYDGTWKG